MKKLLLAVSVSVLCITGAFCQEVTDFNVTEGEWKGELAKFMENELLIIVQNKDTEKIDAAYEEALNLGFSKVEEIKGHGILRMKGQAGESLENMANRLMSQLPEGIIVQPNFVYELHGNSPSTREVCTNPIDPAYSNGWQWHLHNYGQIGVNDADIDAMEAWDYGYGSTDVCVGILDSGIPLNDDEELCHPDLDDYNRIFQGADIRGDGLTGIKDYLGHGTHVAGLVAAETSNQIGIAAIAGGVELYIVQTFDYNGQSNSTVVYNSFLEAIDNGNVDIINLSGGQSSYDAALENAVQYANNNGVLVVVSAGNDNGSISYPARFASSYSNVISVGATTVDNVRASYSNYGSQLVICAPGGEMDSYHDSEGIYSTTPNYSGYTLESVLYQQYDYLDGTSMAAPLVAGVAALVKSQWPAKTPAQVRTILEKSAVDLGTSGWDQYYGYGIVNAFYAVAPPDVPTGLSVSGTSGNPPVLSWSAPTAPDVKQYRIKRVTGGSTTYFTTTNTSYTDWDFRVGNVYWVYYSVRAEDYTDQNSSYTSTVSIKNNGGFYSIGSGPEIALNPSTALPEEFTLDPPVPNPFNASTTIRFGLPAASPVSLSIFDIQGRLVTKLMDGEYSGAGWHSVSWNASDVASGTYFLLARANGQTWNRKLTVIK